MINKETEFIAADNSGAKIVKVIASTKKSLKNIEVGDFILVCIKSLRKKRRIFSKVKKGKVYLGIIVGLSKEKRKIRHSFTKKDDNTAVLLTRSYKLIGNRVYKGLPIELRRKPLIRPLSSTLLKLI
jgi:ribosomal protein L14